MKTNFEAMKEMNKSDMIYFLEGFDKCNVWIEITWSAMNGNEKAQALISMIKDYKYDLFESYGTRTYYEQIKDLDEFYYEGLKLWLSLPYRDCK